MSLVIPENLARRVILPAPALVEAWLRHGEQARVRHIRSAGVDPSKYQQP